MTIRRAGISDFVIVAKLHTDSITTGFLSTLGYAFLKKMYQLISEQPGAIVLVAEIDSKVVGFVAGTITIKGLFKEIVFKNWFRFIIPLINSLISIKNIRKIFETLRYGLKNQISFDTKQIDAELLSISVDQSWRGNGIGKLLVEALEEYFRINCIIRYKVVTFSEDVSANKFYLSCNFIKSHEFNHHGNIMNEYTKELS